MKKILLVCIIVMLATVLFACAKNENSLIGAWYNDSERTVCIFNEGGKLVKYDTRISWHNNPEIQISNLKYEVSGDNKFTVSGDGNGSPVTYTYQISGNTLLLSESGTNFRMNLTRAKNATSSKDRIVGKWHLIGVENAEDTNYKRNLYEITFYSDGTLKGKKNNEWNEAESVSGEYSWIHDGTTLQMAYPVVEKTDVTFPCAGVMILHTYFGDLLYIAQ